MSQCHIPKGPSSNCFFMSVSEAAESENKLNYVPSLCIYVCFDDNEKSNCDNHHRRKNNYEMRAQTTKTNPATIAAIQTASTSECLKRSLDKNIQKHLLIGTPKRSFFPPPALGQAAFSRSTFSEPSGCCPLAAGLIKRELTLEGTRNK